jgi:hypothetical protein
LTESSAALKLRKVTLAPIERIGERGGFRAAVERRSDGLYQVHLERWMRGAILEEPPHWSSVIARTVLANTLPMRER